MTSGYTAVSYRYDIHGKTLASNKCINNPYQYNAEYTDSTTGLQYLRARYYNSDTHRFQTKDTYQGNVAQPITRNNYAYANNNPVNFVDPSGHVPVWLKPVATVAVKVGNWILKGISVAQKIDVGTKIYNVASEHFSEIKALEADISDMEKKHTKLGALPQNPIVKKFLRGWNKTCSCEFSQKALHDQYVDKCDQLEQMKKDAVVNIITDEDLRDVIADDIADVFNGLNYVNACESVKDGEYFDAITSIVSALLDDEKKAVENVVEAAETVEKTMDTVDRAFDYISKQID